MLNSLKKAARMTKNCKSIKKRVSTRVCQYLDILPSKVIWYEKNID